MSCEPLTTRFRLDERRRPLPRWGVWRVPSSRFMPFDPYCRDRRVSRHRVEWYQFWEHDNGRWGGCTEPDYGKGVCGI
jgi:hypothetical protein